MIAESVRCNWRWPLGHWWVYDSLGGDALVKRCQVCGRTKNAGAGPSEIDQWKGGGSSAGDGGGADF